MCQMSVSAAVLVVIGSLVGVAAQPACVLSASGKMLCCPANDAECIAKVQKAHGQPPSSPPTVIEPTRPWLLGSLHTFANASLWDHASPFDVIVVGVPFGQQAGYEAPGLQLVRRETSRMLPYSRPHGLSLKDLVIVDGQDILAGGADRMAELEAAAMPFFKSGRPVIALGGDQSITVPLLQAATNAAGSKAEFAMIHFDKDLAIGTGSLEQELSADTGMFWSAASRLFDVRHSLHVAARGNLPSQQVELMDQELGFETVTAEDMALLGVAGTIERIRARLTRRDGTFMPAYISLDLDVLDPVHLPGSEAGGLSVRELRAILAGLRPFCRVVGADVRGVAALADLAAVRVAAAVASDIVLLAGQKISDAVVPPPLRGTEL